MEIALFSKGYLIAFIALEMTVRMKSKYLGINLGLLICAALTPWAAKADWLNLTGAETAPNIAEIYVQDDGVKLVLEVIDEKRLDPSATTLSTQERTAAAESRRVVNSEPQI